MTMDHLQQQRILVANGCRVLAHRGLVDDILGHISLRVDDRTVLVRCRGPQEKGLAFTLPEDIHEVDLSGDHDLPEGYSVPNELPLHLAALASDPEAHAVVHAHPPAVVALSLTGETLRPIVGAYNIPAMRMALAGVPVHPSAALIRTDERASAMLHSMGQSPVCILRGHGLTATGRSVQQAVIRAINLDALAQIQLRVLSVGASAPLIDDDDLSDLPDLGSAFNDDNVWRFHLAALEHARLLLA